MNQNERRDMPIIIGIAIAAGLAVVLRVMCLVGRQRDFIGLVLLY